MVFSGISITGTIISGRFLDFSFPITLGTTNTVPVGFDTGFAESFFIISPSKADSEITCPLKHSSNICLNNTSTSQSFKHLPPLSAPPVFFNEDIKGIRVKDTLQLTSAEMGKIILPDCAFTLVNQSLVHSSLGSHGIIGLGFGSSFLANARDKGLISNKLFGFSVSDDDSTATLDLGFWNLQQIEFMHNLTTLQLHNASLPKQTVMPFGVLISNVYLDDGRTSHSIIPPTQKNQMPAVIRTTRSISYFPSLVMNSIVEATNATRTNSSLLYNVSCQFEENFPILTIQFKTTNGGLFNATWKPEEYIFQYSKVVDTQKNCFLGMTEDPGLSFSDFFLSLGLLRKYYIGMDADRTTISLGSYLILNLTNPTPALNGTSSVPENGLIKPHSFTSASSESTSASINLSFLCPLFLTCLIFILK